MKKIFDKFSVLTIHSNSDVLLKKLPKEKEYEN
jgi:hypothetical protein